MTNEKAIDDFNAAVQSKMAHGLSREAAVDSVRKSQPALTQSYLLACNPGARQQRELAETFDALSKLTG